MEMTNTGVKISVVVMTYFHQKYIHEALDTILGQEGEVDFEIIVTDDCSKDNTVSILEEYRKQYPEKIKLILHEKNVGICANLYGALLQCKGDYIVISAGDDCWVDKNKLEKQYSFLENNKEYLAECVCVEGRYEDGELTGTISPEPQLRNKEFKRQQFLDGGCFPTAGMMMRNIFVQERAQKQFGLMKEFSRDLDDLTFSFFMFDYGKIHIADFVGYAITVRREQAKGEHNYNSKYKDVHSAVEYLKVLQGVYKYYEGKYDISAWYKRYWGNLLYYIIKKRQIWAVKYIPMIPFSYVGRCLKYILKK